MGGGGFVVAGSSSVSQLPDVKKISSRAVSTLTGDQTLPHAVSVRSKSQPSRVVKKSAGRPSAPALKKPPLPGVLSFVSIPKTTRSSPTTTAGDDVISFRSELLSQVVQPVPASN